MHFKPLTIIFALFYLFILVVESKGQNPNDAWKKITDFQDKDIGEVYTITSDKANLLWLGTSTGLYTYDGFYFDQVLDFAVGALLFERNGEHLWIGTRFDLYRLNTKSGSLKKLNLEKKLVSSAEYFFNSFYEDSMNRIWATSFNGLYKCESDTCLNFLVEQNPEIVQQDPYLNRFSKVGSHNHPDTLFIAALKGVYTFNSRSNIFHLTPYSSTIVSHLINNNEQLILSKFKGEIEIHDLKNQHTTIINLPDNALITDIKGTKNILWICTDGGLLSWNGKLTIYANIAEALYSSKPPKCHTIYEDNYGHLWAGYENGLYLWDPYSKLVSAALASDILSDIQPEIYDIEEISDGQLLITSNAPDINKYNIKDRSTEKYLHGVEELIVISDTLWVLIEHENLIKYNPVNRKRRVLLDAPAFKLANLAYYLSNTVDPHSKTLIIGLQWGRGIVKINLQNGSYQRFDQVDFFNKNQFTTTGFSYLALDNDYLYFTSGKGMGKLNLLTGKAVIITNERKTACTGLDTNIKGQIFAVFEKDGVYQITPKFLRIDNDIVNIETIYFDEDDKLWATSPEGVSNIHLASQSHFTLNKANGLPKNNLYGAKLIDGRSGRLYAYTSEWIAYFDKGDLLNLSIHNKTPTISTFPNHSFRFSSRNYKPSGMTNYEYRLKGLKDHWERANQLNEVQYNNLSGGKYEFQVRSSFAGKPWKYSEKINLIIPFPWWKRWYIVLGAVTLICAALFLYNYQIRKQEQLKLQLKTMEMQTLRSQMNPHFIFNALNSIKLYILGNDKFAAAEYLSNFSMLIRKILSHSKSESISLSEELETLKLYIDMEQMRFNYLFEYEIHVDENVDPDMVTIPPLILQPYIENAIWHGLLHKVGVGLLSLKIRRVKELMIYEIEDNGIGRERAAAIKTKTALKKKSLGMQITKERLGMSKSKASVEVTDLSQGTKVIIKIPDQ